MTTRGHRQHVSLAVPRDHRIVGAIVDEEHGTVTILTKGALGPRVVKHLPDEMEEVAVTVPPKNGGLERPPQCRLIALMRTFQSGSPKVGL